MNQISPSHPSSAPLSLSLFLSPPRTFTSSTSSGFARWRRGSDPPDPRRRPIKTTRMSHDNRQQPPVGVPPRQGYPSKEYPEDAYAVPRVYAYFPRPLSASQPQPQQPPPQQPPNCTGFLESCLAVLCCCCLVDACF